MPLFLGRKQSTGGFKNSYEQQVAELRQEVSDKKSTREREAKYAKFGAFCSEHGYAATNEESVSTFLVQHFNNTGTAKTVRRVLSQLRVAHRNHKIRFLPQEDEAAVEEVIQRLEYKDTAPVKRKVALRGKLINKLTCSLDLSKQNERCLAICMNMGHDGLLRGHEITQRQTTQDHGAMVADFEPMSDDSATNYKISRTKTSRTGGAISINFGRIASKGHWDAHSLIKLHLSIGGLGDKPTAPFFPSYVTTSWLRSQLKQLAHRHGINPSWIGNHSLRSGGATDLFCSNIPQWVIMKFGRWNSNAVLLYQRDDEDIVQRVRKGFREAK